jgi:archaellum biogenesis ATPase FlaH
MKRAPLSPRSNGGSGGGGVIGAFNEFYKIEAILSRNGYQPRGNRYLAPDSTTGLPGVHIFEDTGRCYSHHANDLLNDGYAHNAFSAFCILEHGNDVRAAVKAAAAELGIERTQPPPEDTTDYDQDDEEEAYIEAERNAIQGEVQELPPDRHGPQTTQETPSKPLITLEQLLAMEFPETRELIGGGIWPAGTGLMIAGESGAGKSLLLNQLVLSLAMGWNFIGLKVPTAQRVLVFQAENTLQQDQERYIAQIRGMGITATPPNIAYFPMVERLELSNQKNRGIMVDAIKSHQADIFFVDPLISFHEANENDNGAMRRVLDYITEIMRKTGAGAGVLHHFGKPTDNGALEHRARGASAIRDWCDTMLALTVKKAADGYLHEITFVKVRNGRQPKPIILERDENLVFQVTEEESRYPPEQVAQIIRAKGGRVNSQKDLAAAIQGVIKCGERTAIKFIKKAVDRQTILAVIGDRDPYKAGPTPNAYVPNDQG